MAEVEDRWSSGDEIDKSLDVGGDAVCHWIDKHAMPANRRGCLWKFQKD